MSDDMVQPYLTALEEASADRAILREQLRRVRSERDHWRRLAIDGDRLLADLRVAFDQLAAAHEVVLREGSTEQVVPRRFRADPDPFPDPFPG